MWTGAFGAVSAITSEGGDIAISLERQVGCWGLTDQTKCKRDVLRREVTPFPAHHWAAPASESLAM